MLASVRKSITAGMPDARAFSRARAKSAGPSTRSPLAADAPRHVGEAGVDERPVLRLVGVPARSSGRCAPGSACADRLRQ